MKVASRKLPTIKHRLDSAWLRQQEGHLQEAEASYRHVIQHAPSSSSAWSYLGMVLAEQGRHAEAEAAYRQALRIRPQFPTVLNNLGNSLRVLGRIDDALQAFETASKQDGDYVSPWLNRGTLWVFEGEYEKAIGAFHRGLEIQPDHGELHRNLGVILLASGRYAEGWREYAWRWRTKRQQRPKLSQPVWDGSDLRDKRIVIYPEQGLGDIIHFVRYVQKLKEQGATTYVQLPARMIPMLTSCPGIDQLLPSNVFPKEFDFHCSLIDIAEHLQVDASSVADSFPSCGHYLMAPENLMDKWNTWLSEQLDENNADRKHRKKRVGICWQGNPKHGADSLRSIPLTQFSGLAARSDINLVCLQFGHGIEQLQSAPFADRITQLPESVDRATDAFIDTSVILKNLDLVITSDTSMAHLAGALGIPVWVGLPLAADWRWGRQGETTDWYPSMRLFRQPQKHDWDSVFLSIGQALDGPIVS